MGSNVELFLALAMLVLLGAVLFATLWILRSKFRAIEDDGGITAFTLDDLRALHKQGQLTDQEYRRARSRIIRDSQELMARRIEAARKQAGPVEPLESRLRQELDEALVHLDDEQELEQELEQPSTPPPLPASQVSSTDQADSSPPAPPALPDSEAARDKAQTEDEGMVTFWPDEEPSPLDGVLDGQDEEKKSGPDGASGPRTT